MKNSMPTKQITVRYLSGLGLFALLCIAFVIGLIRLNNDLISITLFNDQVREMNLIAEEINSNVYLLDGENIPEIRNNIALSSLVLANQLEPLASSSEYFLNEMSSSARGKILNSDAFGENYIWPYARISQIAGQMETVRKLERKGAPISYIDSFGRKLRISDPEPMILMANKIASPYVNFIKSARKEQRVFLFQQILEYSYYLRLLINAFMIASAVVLLLIGLLIFNTKTRRMHTKTDEPIDINQASQPA